MAFREDHEGGGFGGGVGVAGNTEEEGNTRGDKYEFAQFSFSFSCLCVRVGGVGGSVCVNNMFFGRANEEDAESAGEELELGSSRGEGGGEAR